MWKRDETSKTEELAAGGLSKLSGTLEAAGEAARRSGTAVRDGLHDSARAVERGGTTVRRWGLAGAAIAAGRKLGRAGAAAVGLVAAAGAAFAALAIARRGKEDRSAADEA